ncbi:17134_t:CDS:1, partial [Funneliformis geosporum]
YILKWIRSQSGVKNTNIKSALARILIVRAKTGSEKSTILPVEMHKYLNRFIPANVEIKKRDFKKDDIICTQPRVLTTIFLAKDVSSSGYYKDMVLEKTVGYQTEPNSRKPIHGLLYATVGILVAHMQMSTDAEIIEKYRIIIIDEAHERSLESDFLLMLLKNFYEHNRLIVNLPFLILTSVTFDIQRYAKYFGVGPSNYLDIMGRAYDIETHWPRNGFNNYIMGAVEQIIEIHQNNLDDLPAKADILVFTPGAGEAMAICQELVKKLAQLEKPFLLLTLNREIVAAQRREYHLVFAKPKSLPLVNGHKVVRRVILTTTVAETGLTINTLRYVVDSGWHRSRETYQPWGISGIITRPASQSRILQKKGRAGRLFPGDFYPLYTENTFNTLEEQQLPDIITLGVDPIFLALIAEQRRHKELMETLHAINPKLFPGFLNKEAFRVEDLDLLDPPPPEAFLVANSKAISFGFIEIKNLDRSSSTKAQPFVSLMPLGEVALRFSRVPMEGARILFSGYVWNCSASDLATVVSLIGAQSNVFLSKREMQNKKTFSGSKALLASVSSFLTGIELAEILAFFHVKILIADAFLENLLIFDAFAEQLEDPVQTKDWCENLGLDYTKLVGIANIHETVIGEMVVAELDPFCNSEYKLKLSTKEFFISRLINLKKCLYYGFRGNLLTLTHASNKKTRNQFGIGSCYVTRQGLTVHIPTPLLPELLIEQVRDARLAFADSFGMASSAESRPQWLLTDSLQIVPEQRNEMMYSLSANILLVIDGYVPIDTTFDRPRSFF